MSEGSPARPHGICFVSAATYSGLTAASVSVDVVDDDTATTVAALPDPAGDADTITLTATVVVLLWQVSRLGALVALTCLYGGAAVFLYVRLNAMLRNWKNLPATLEQLRKDRECLEKSLT